MAVHDYGHRFKYMAVIDADEFMFIRKDFCGEHNLYKFVDEFMTPHPNAGRIAVKL